jgi:uncharacterized glyoxalase superfamily metalloenzyme YdcJ
METSHATGQKMDNALRDVFAQFPDSWTELYQQRLVYCAFTVTGKAVPSHMVGLEQMPDDFVYQLLRAGVLSVAPITYEDFLPFSAAGIFQSNLGKASSAMGHVTPFPNQQGFESSLGRSVLDPDVLYSDMQRKSLEKCSQQLGFKSLSLSDGDLWS